MMIRRQGIRAASGRMLWVLCVLIAGTTVAQAQSKTIKFPAGEITSGRVLREIERQTDYAVAFNSQLFDTTYMVRYSAGERSVEETLATLVAGRNYEYSIRGTFIVLSIKAQSAPKPVAPKYPVRTGDLYRQGTPGDPAATPNLRPGKEQAVVMPAVIASPVELSPAPWSEYTSLSDTYTRLHSIHPRYAIKTNLLYGAGTLTPNLGVEFGLDGRSSLDLSVGYNPWNRRGSLSDNKKFAHTVVVGEYRRWLCERFNGHFFGVHGLYTNFNIGGYDIPLWGIKKQYRYEGWGVGAGVSYGYNLPLSTRWGVEFNVGVGVVWRNYDQYQCTICSRVLESKNDFRFTPTRAGINLIFMIK